MCRWVKNYYSEKQRSATNKPGQVSSIRWSQHQIESCYAIQQAKEKNRTMLVLGSMISVGHKPKQWLIDWNADQQHQHYLETY